MGSTLLVELETPLVVEEACEVLDSCVIVSVVDATSVLDVTPVVDVASSVELSVATVLVEDDAPSVVLDGTFSVLEREETDGRQGPAMLPVNSDTAVMKP